IAELLGELAHELDVCIITVTHDPAVADVADRVLEVSECKLIEKNSSKPAGKSCGGLYSATFPNSYDTLSSVIISVSMRIPFWYVTQ
ncbi:hypothetical protein QP381_08915, partial [Pauljensenia sp. UMB6358]|nr:hypothetical protein [Pauljensenia sp. UMB6358]